MKEQLISFETAKLANITGFTAKFNIDNWYNQDGIQNHHYQLETYPCTTQSLLQKWLREEHNIYLTIFNYSKEPNEVLGFRSHIFPYLLTQVFSTYEEALEKGLQEALKLIK